MEIGTAIFLSTLVLSLALIVVFTRGRVRWGRILLIGLAAVLGIGVIGGGIAYVVNSYEYRRTAVTELDGIKLGDTEADVLFKRGINYSEKCVLEKTKDKDAVVYYRYEVSKKGFSVSLIDGLVQQIVVAYELGYDSPPNSIAIYDNESEDTIREKWGKEDFIRSDRPSIRTYVYRRYNLAVVLANNRAAAVYVFNPKYYYKDASIPPDRKQECFDSDGKPKSG